MDKFVLVLGIIGLVLLAIAIVVIVQTLIGVFKKRTKWKGFLSSFVAFLILCGFGLAFTSLAMFLYTFSRYMHEKKIGYIVAEESNDTIIMTFMNETTGESHLFRLSGDQWVVEGHIMRWSPSLRWLGAGSYYCLTGFVGRDLLHSDKVTYYRVAPDNGIWRFLLKNGDKFPFVDAVYGIGAFQYPSRDTFHLYINDTGFILKKK
jgi:hypothetical protein